MARRFSYVRTRRIATVAGSVLASSALLIGLAGCGAPTSPSHISVGTGTSSTDANSISVGEALRTALDDPRTIEVTGSDKILATPDMAEVELGVTLLADDADTAQQSLAKTLAKVTDELEELGVDVDDIAVSNLRVYPQYDYSESVEKIAGYQANVSITVKNLTLEDAGRAVSAATTAGANQVQGVSYYCSDYDALYGQALDAAMAMAQNKARSIAAANGDTLGDVLSVIEEYDSQAYRNVSGGTAVSATGQADAAAKEEASDFGGINLDPGTIAIQASVTVQYQLL